MRLKTRLKTAKEVAKEVKRRAKRVKEELGDVVAVKEVGKQTKDVVLQKVKPEEVENLEEKQQKNKLIEYIVMGLFKNAGTKLQNLIIVVLCILLFLRTFGGGETIPTERVVTKIETRYDTLTVEKKVYVPKYTTRIETKTITDTIVLKSKIDTLEILKDYYSKYVYQDTLKLDSLGYITIIDTITQNKIFSRNFDSQVLIPTTTITNEIYLNRAKFFGGVSLGGNSKQINFLSGDLLYKSKRDNVYGLGLGVNQNFQPIVIGRMYWKISLRKDRDKK